MSIKGIYSKNNRQTSTVSVYDAIEFGLQNKDLLHNLVIDDILKL